MCVKFNIMQVKCDGIETFGWPRSLLPKLLLRNELPLTLTTRNFVPARVQNEIN